jgi:hypothetical protein
MALPCCSVDVALKHEFRKLVEEYNATSTLSNPLKKRKLTHTQEHFIITRLYSVETGKWSICQKHFQDLTGAKNPGRLRSRLVRQRENILMAIQNPPVPRKIPKDPTCLPPPAYLGPPSSSIPQSLPPVVPVPVSVSPSQSAARRRTPCVSCKRCLGEWTGENLKQKKELFRSLAKDEKFGLSACSVARLNKGKVRKNQLSTAEKRFLVNHLFDDEGQSLMCQKCFRNFTGLKSTKTLVKRVRSLIIENGRALLDLNPSLLQHRRSGKGHHSTSSDSVHNLQMNPEGSMSPMEGMPMHQMSDQQMNMRLHLAMNMENMNSMEQMTMDQMSMEQIEQMNQMNQMEQMSRLEQLNRLEHLSQMEQMSRMEQINRMSQMGQMEHMEQMGQMAAQMAQMTQMEMNSEALSSMNQMSRDNSTMSIANQLSQLTQMRNMGMNTSSSEGNSALYEDYAAHYS